MSLHCQHSALFLSIIDNTSPQEMQTSILTCTPFQVKCIGLYIYSISASLISIIIEKPISSEVRSLRTELKKLLADDFFEFGSSGKILYKGEDIAEDLSSLIILSVDNT